MKNSTLKVAVAMICAVAMSYSSAFGQIQHGSIKGSGLKIYDQYNEGTLDASTEKAGITFDYKIVTIGQKSWVRTSLTGAALKGDEWASQLRYWGGTDFKTKTENNLKGRALASVQSFGVAQQAIPSPLQITFFQALKDGEIFAETARVNYDVTAKNSPVAGDATVPVISSCDITTVGKTAKLTLAGSDNSGDYFYHIADATHGIEEISLTNSYELVALELATEYNLVITPIDFTGNEGTPLTKSFTTDATNTVIHGSIKGVKAPLYTPYASPAAFDISTVRTGVTVDYKAVTIGANTWAWTNLNGGTLGGEEWSAQLRYWSGNGFTTKAENVLYTRVNDTQQAYYKSTQAIPDAPIQITLFQNNGGDFTETARISYDIAAINTPVAGDATAPTLGSVTKNSNNLDAVMLTMIDGADNSGDFFYHIADEANGIEEVLFHSNSIIINGLTTGKTYHFVVTPIDFSGNQGTAQTVTQALGSSIENVSGDDLIVYPNPVKDILNFSRNVEGTVELINLQGSVIYRGQNINRIDLSLYTSGVYFVKTDDGKTRKILKVD